MSSSEKTIVPILNMEKCTVILLDVAGTTTSINFVKETLFPYATKQADDFLKTNWDDEVVKEAVKLLQDNGDTDLKKATELFKELTEKNSENSGLKTLQGLIYKKGYADGELKAHVFDDVSSSLELWAKTRKIAIFSTGSIESQQLLFKNTIQGDLSAHISNYFDQTIGPKVESESYVKIAEKMNCKPAEMAFITDNTDEAKAAKTAGLEVALIKREGNPEITQEISNEYSVLNSFQDVVTESSTKRKIEEDDNASTEQVPPSKVAKTESADKVVDKKIEEEVVQKEDAEEKMEVDGAEKPTAESETKTEEPTKVETETKDSSPTEKTEEKTDNEKAASVEEEAPKAEETKPVAEEASDKKEESVVESENADSVDNKTNPTEKTDDSKKETEPEEDKPQTETTSDEKTDETKTDGKVDAEKENNSEVANGVENTNTDDKNGVEDNKLNGDKKDDELNSKSEENEIKVKKIEETSESTTTATSEVSVEA